MQAVIGSEAKNLGSFIVRELQILRRPRLFRMTPEKDLRAAMGWPNGFGKEIARQTTTNQGDGNEHFCGATASDY
jgi:hypothetical protein